MKALRAHRRGGPEVLGLEDTARPTLVPDHVLVRVLAAAITFDELLWDETWMRNGVDRTPIIPSHEWSGLVEEAAAGSGFTRGGPVYGMTPFDQDGAAADYALVPVDFLAPTPSTLTPVEAAALPLAGLTAQQALVDHGGIARGDDVLVLGGAGGVGSFAVQFARLLGANVTATVNRPEDIAFVSALGAEAVIDGTAQQLPTGRYDIVLDTVGGPVTTSFVDRVRRGGTYINLQAPPSQERLDALGARGVFFVVSASSEKLARLADQVDSGHVSVNVAATYPLAEGRRAFESKRSTNRVPGKTVLVL